LLFPKPIKSLIEHKKISGFTGAGMVLKIDGLWKIVGMVSTCITKPDYCDLNNYLVYTDVSKFNSWIERVIIDSYNDVSAGRSVLGNTFQMKLFFFIFLSVFFF
jgi:hypothetical protein